MCSPSGAYYNSQVQNERLINQLVSPSKSIHLNIPALLIIQDRRIKVATSDALPPLDLPTDFHARARARQTQWN